MNQHYLAGFFDGEGCIDTQVMYPKPPYDKQLYVRPRLRVSQAVSGGVILEMLKKSYGGHLLYAQKQGKNQQDYMSWEILDKKGIIGMLQLLEPLLVIKKQQARLCLWWFANAAGKHIGEPARRAFSDELKLMKRDPQRLSEEAVTIITSLMR